MNSSIGPGGKVPNPQGKKPLIYRMQQLLDLGVSAKDISDCIRAGLMVSGWARINGQSVKMVEITDKGRELMKNLPNAKRETDGPAADR